MFRLRILAPFFLSLIVATSASAVQPNKLTIGDTEYEVGKVISCEPYEAGSTRIELEIMIMASSPERGRLTASIASVGNMGKQHEISWSGAGEQLMSDAMLDEPLVRHSGNTVSGAAQLMPYPAGGDGVLVEFRVQAPDKRRQCQ